MELVNTSLSILRGKNSFNENQDTGVSNFYIFIPGFRTGWHLLAIVIHVSAVYWGKWIIKVCLLSFCGFKET